MGGKVVPHGGSRARVLAHLEDVLASPSLQRAERQAEILRVLVDAALAGRGVHGRELALAVYGRADEGSIHALKQAVHNLRRSLALHYAGLASAPAVRFELSERGYVVQIAGAEPRPPTTTPSGPRAWWRSWGLLLPVVAAAAVVAAVGLWPSRPRPGPANTEQVSVPVSTDRQGSAPEDWTGTPDRSSGGEKSGAVPPQEHLQVATLDSGTDHPVVAVARMPPGKPGEGVLSAFDGRSRELLDSLLLPHFPGRRPPEKLHFGSHAVPCLFHLGPFGAHALDGDGERNDLVLGLSMSTGPDVNYPSQILVVEFAGRWRLRRSYWTIGSSDPHLVRDFDGDGRAEILVRGHNNDWNEGVLVILRPDEPDGRTPFGPDRKIFEEVAQLPENGLVLRFPRTKLSLDPDYRTARGVVKSVDADVFPAPRFVVTVGDVAPYPFRDDDVAGDLDFDLSLDREEFAVTFKPYDFYRVEMRRLFPEESPADYADALGAQVQYWDGSEPVPRWRTLTPAALRKLLGRPAA